MYKTPHHLQFQRAAKGVLLTHLEQAAVLSVSEMEALWSAAKDTYATEKET